ncbi:hypothetical protein F4778DRAFT_744975, partial [Xylariomycetidae sp. FL2044]
SEPSRYSTVLLMSSLFFEWAQLEFLTTWKQHEEEWSGCHDNNKPLYQVRSTPYYMFSGGGGGASSGDVPVWGLRSDKDVGAPQNLERFLFFIIAFYLWTRPCLNIPSSVRASLDELLRIYLIYTRRRNRE